MKAIALATLVAAIPVVPAGAFGFDLIGGGPVGKSMVPSVVAAGFGDVSFEILAGKSDFAVGIRIGEPTQFTTGGTGAVDFLGSPAGELEFSYFSVNRRELARAVRPMPSTASLASLGPVRPVGRGGR